MPVLGIIASSAAGGSPTPYHGPLDLVSGAVVAYGQRAMAAANIGSAVYTIRRDSDGTTLEVLAESDGGVDAAAITAFIGGDFVRVGSAGGGDSQITLVDATGVMEGQTITGDGVPPDTVVTNTGLSPLIIVSNTVDATTDVNYSFSNFGRIAPWNDKSGNGLNLPFTAASSGSPSAFWQAAGPNGKPSNNLKQSDTAVLSASAFATGEVSFFILSKGLFETGFYPNSGNQSVDLNTGSEAYISSSDADGDTAGGDYANALSDSAYILWDGAWKTGSADLKANGAAVTQVDSYDSGVVGAIADSFFNLFGFGTDIVNAEAVEIIFYDRILSGADRTLVRQNMADYYGITLA